MGLFEETPVERRRSAARNTVESGAWRLTADALERDGITDREVFSHVVGIYPGSDITRRTLRPPYALTAARDLLFAAREHMRRVVADARGEGMTWPQIGETLGLGKAAEEAGMTLARAAWRLAAMDAFPGDPDRVSYYAHTYGVAARWRCGTCFQPITERDIDEGVAAQDGHEAGCGLSARERLEERRRWEDG